MKSKFHNAFKFITCFLFAALLFTACKKDDDSPDPIVPTGSTIRTTVTGRVTSADGNILIGATVKLAGITTVTDNHGNFLFVNINAPAIRMVLNASMTGFFDCVKGKKTQTGGVNYINIVMEPIPNASFISGASGGVVTIPGGASITFPVNAFVDASGNPYTGQVKVYATHLNTGNPNFEAMIPGGDLIAKNSAGQFQSLYSLGMIEAKLYDNTGINEVQLAPGKTAELQFPIDPSQNSAALATIPMWYLNEITGIWQEEGQAIKTGSSFIGSVSHFTIWNCDYPGDRADIKGVVVDCNNNPMPNVTVTIDNFKNVTTDNTGSFTTWVPTGFSIGCQLLKQHNPMLDQNSNIQYVNTLSGTMNIVPTIVAICIGPRVIGSIKDCSGTIKKPGLIYISGNGINMTYYSVSGDYNLGLPENSSIRLIAFNGMFQGETSIVTNGFGSITNAPDILLCNTTNILHEQVYFKLIQNGISEEHTITAPNINAIFADVNSDGTFESLSVVMVGLSQPDNNTCNFNMGLNLETNGYFSLNASSQNNVYININTVGAFGNGNFTITTLNRVTITDYGAPGGYMTGTFEFNAAGGAIVTDGYFSFRR